MLGKLFDLMTKVFTLTSKVDRLEKDVQDLRQDLRHISEKLNQQSAEIKVLMYAIQRESDNTKLWVEKEMAKFERRLPQGKDYEKED